MGARRAGRRASLVAGALLALVSNASLADTEPYGPRPAAFPVPKPPPAAIRPDPAAICGLIARAADAHGLPRDFLARLIWKESRFDARALSPAGAQGIAQFMPETARQRGLADPWDPFQAIPASAGYLADLTSRFGNLGLAAAAYNGGPDRVARWLAEGGYLPGETVDYVRSITARPVEWFREPGREVEPRPLQAGTDFATACGRLPVISTRALAAIEGGAPWGVQVAAGITRRAALRAFRRARTQLASVIGDESAIVVRQRRGAAPRYSARIGAASRIEARRLCARIRHAGGVCLVRRN